MMNNDTLFENAIKVFNHLEFIQNEIEKNNKEIAKKEQQLTKLNVYNTDLQFARNYLDLLIKNESNSFIKSINEILNYGLKTIFYDCDYSIDINIDNEKSKSNIYLVYTDEMVIKFRQIFNNVAAELKQLSGFYCKYFLSFIMN